MQRKKKTSARMTGCRQVPHICPICCIVPPHMLKEVLQNGNAEQRAWAFQTLTVSEQFRGRRLTVGNISFAVSAGEKRRTIFDAKNGNDLPGTLVRSEGDPPSGDPAIDEAYDGSGATYDLYDQVFERNSIDGRGLRLDSTVHFGVKYDNAFWNGDQMVYGDGDGEIFERFTKAIDVIGHELTHGVTQYEANLIYYSESGALNESFSDVFGSLVKQRVLNQTAQEADWIIGEGLFTPSIKGVGIRSMKAPGTAYDDPVLGKDPQPATYQNRYKGLEDNGGVHINSGIGNRAFYLAAVEIGGYAWEKAGKIWYIALRDRLRSRANFKRAANTLITVAGELYGEGSKEQNAVRKGWKEVGVI
ncbi:M4 family metallopeptidase [Coleofasciculus sp. H7-2]|uniref:M4 family metallopeptidase n=1 Tax=Coleofasciculus sp. H7-2 TaxID=3351545 RepID=UPI00366E856F